MRTVATGQPAAQHSTAQRASDLVATRVDHDFKALLRINLCQLVWALPWPWILTSGLQGGTGRVSLGDPMGMLESNARCNKSE